MRKKNEKKLQILFILRKVNQPSVTGIIYLIKLCTCKICITPVYLIAMVHSKKKKDQLIYMD